LQLQKHLPETDHRSVGNPIDLLFGFNNILHIFLIFNYKLFRTELRLMNIMFELFFFVKNNDFKISYVFIVTFGEVLQKPNQFYQLVCDLFKSFTQEMQPRN
jgi:TRAP-type mannitol/chloroaromatic compound transport system permease large subunit